jgi:enoyl-CoA hydratase/carnithine racemase
MSESSILAEIRNHVGHLTLNRPAGLNALSLDMVRDIQRQLSAWADDEQVYAVVLRSSSPKAFCAGGDIRSLHDSFKNGDTLHVTFFEEEYALDQYIHAYSKPIVALVNGFCLGGGMGLVQGAALRVVTETAKMGMPETGIGYFPDVGGSYFLPRLPGELGIYLGVSGRQIGAADALYCKLADWYLASESVEEFDRCLDTMGWTTSAHESLRSLLATLATDKLPGSEIKAFREAIDGYFSEADLPAIRAALVSETRPQYQDFAEEVARLLDTRSPLAMSVTLALLRQGRDMSLEECFALEMHLDKQWFARGDIVEGVRALIIDKDKSPRWNPPSIGEVSSELVQSFFQGFKTARRG